VFPPGIVAFPPGVVWFPPGIGGVAWYAFPSKEVGWVVFPPGIVAFPPGVVWFPPGMVAFCAKAAGVTSASDMTAKPAAKKARTNTLLFPVRLDIADMLRSTGFKGLSKNDR
jgi:hypothetical protein